MVEWVEVRGKTVEVAVAAAMQELGIDSREGIDVEVIQEPERGFLGLGGRDAIVRVKPRAEGRGRRRRRGREDRGARPGSGDGPSPQRQPDRSDRPSGRRPQGQARQDERPSAGQRRPPGGGSGSGPDRTGQRPRGAESRPRSPGAHPRPRPATRESTADPHQQAPMVEEFLTGLVGAFGLDGRVTVTVDDEVIVAAIEGEQTEALVGPRGSVMEAIHEITKTVLHRQVDDTARVRIDVAGYAERRRQALSIYAAQLIEQVTGEGGEIMLEPMSAADRKVIHDAVAAHDGVRSYSEGEPPRRYVVIAAVETEAESAAESGPPVHSSQDSSSEWDEGAEAAPDEG
ncbi:MAG TPA: RNA-binding cell elongation regulator Jag/EloR [Acidimicrobiia bacterium]|nr:RNA-binding cell elongation regulator Jag/EloR [Acidimicrobiia bacterium]